MNQDFERIKTLYRDSLTQFGDSTEALLTPKGRQEERFSVPLQLVKEGDRILDFGCGLGYLLSFLNEHCNSSFEYHGVDLSDDFIDVCKNKFRADNCRFDVIGPHEDVSGRYDIVFCSGVFNIKYGNDREAHKSYVFNKLQQLYHKADRLLITDFLSPNVDFKQDDSFHIDYDSLLGFCQKNLSRRWSLRHDLLPYEVMLIVNVDERIARPQNVFEVAG